ncbi:MAG: CAP domain-containing protein [Isosphaeraceae bacterium]
MHESAEHGFAARSGAPVPRRSILTAGFACLGGTHFLGTAEADDQDRERPADDRKLIREVLDAHNAVRTKAKLPPLRSSDILQKAAILHAEDMAKRNVMSHEGGDGSTAAQRVEKAGYFYRKTGENVARGQTTSSGVMRAWLDSPPHKANILGEFEEIGIGVARSSEQQPYWCVEFGTPWPTIDVTRSRSEFLAAVNAERVAKGKKPLRANAKLERIATDEATVMARSAQLGGGENRGEALVRAIRDAGYVFRSIGQLAASGQPTARDLTSYLLKTDDNRELLLGDYVDAGVGVAVGPKRMPYWFIILARPLRETR